MTSSRSSAAPSTDGGGAPERRRQLYGRRQGPRLSPARRRLLEDLLPRLAVPLPAAGERLCVAGLFGGPRPVRLEIGFGGGEHLAAQAQGHPGTGFLGVEPFLNGVAKLLAAIEERGIGNVRVLVDDARLLLEALPDGALERIDVLFPDPWPKARHHKRRIVNPATVGHFARALVPGGELRLATDDGDYARTMLEAVLAEPRLAWAAERAADWRERDVTSPPTRYESKAREAGRAATFLRFRRRAE